MPRKLLAAIKNARWAMLRAGFSVLCVGAALAPSSLFADGRGIDCWSLYDGCCDCRAGKVGGGEELRGGASIPLAGGEGEAGYYCKKDQSSGYNLCENDGTNGYCGHSGPVCRRGEV